MHVDREDGREGARTGRGRRGKGGGKREIEREREGLTENGVFRGLVFWILTS